MSTMLQQIQLASTSLEVISIVVKHCPELDWLTGSVKASPDDQPAFTPLADHKTLGELLYPELPRDSLLEFNRTAMAILAFIWVYFDRYDQFVACQSNGRLTPESFHDLQALTRRVITDAASFEAMVLSLAINDLGKVDAVAKLIENRKGIQEVDHDKLLRYGLENFPEMFPSFSQLAPSSQALLLNGLRSDFNLAQFVQGEAVPASLMGLREVDTRSFRFLLLHTVFDVAGGAGHVVQNGSATMTETTWQIFSMAIDTLDLLRQGAAPVEVYRRYISQRVESVGLSVDQADLMALGRLCCLLRVNSTEQAATVRSVFYHLPLATRETLTRELSVTGFEDYAIIVAYAAALLTNLVKKLGFTNGLEIGLETLARVYRQSRVTLANLKGQGVYTVVVLSLANLATQKPDAFPSITFHLRRVGDNAEIVVGD